MKYSNPESDIRNAIIKKFRSLGITIKRIENSICGRHKSVPDLWFADRVTKTAGWIEVKSATGRLSKGPDSQEEFQADCNICNVNHWVVRSVNEAVAATGRSKYDDKRLMDIEFTP